MKNIIYGWTLMLITWTGVAWGIPTQLTYQGSLRQNNVPVTDHSKKMRFSIYDPGQTTPIYQSDTLNVDVQNGLFSVKLNLPDYDWSAVNPVIEVQVDGQALGPREPITANLYAIVSSNVVNGAITPNKIAPGYGLVPKGAIMMFDTDCPLGWTEYVNLRGRFPAGADSLNPALFTLRESSGSLTHKHTIAAEPAHSHAIPIYETSDGVGFGWSKPTDDEFGYNIINRAVRTEASPYSQNMLVNKIALSGDGGAHSHTGNTGDESSLPKYFTVLFCQKL